MTEPGKTYMNIHTGEIRRVVSIETDNNPPIVIYVLDTGERIAKRIFEDHWKVVENV